MAGGRRLFIATERANHRYLERFSKYAPIYLCGTPVEDLICAQLFTKIIISSSTFAWWAAVLSNASTVYFPIADDHLWGLCYKQAWPNIDLRIDDPRFIYFYNCPTIKNWRVSSKLSPLVDVNPKVASFHRHSKAFWYI